MSRALERLVPPEGPILPVLMYHSISEEPEPGVPPYYRLCVSPRRFAEQMQWLHDHGFQGVSLSEGLDWLRAQSPTSSYRAGPRPVAITFDDGFQDFFTAAFPVLRQHEFRATVYVATSFIGDTRRRFQPRGMSSVPGVAGRSCLTWAEVRDLAAGCIEIGGHTVSHPELPRLQWREIEREVRDCKEAIEQQLGQPVRSFAHPYAFPQERPAYVERLRDLLQAAGYRSAVTTRLGRVRPSADPYTLSRLPINDADDPRLLEAKLTGAYDWMGRLQQLHRWWRSRNGAA